MCTAVTYKTDNHYFGRTLDYDFSYSEEAVVTPRCYPLKLSDNQVLKHHYALIGTAFVKNDYPLYYDAVNEKGLAAAGLSFSAEYSDSPRGAKSVAPYELIPSVLSQCSSLSDVKAFFKDRVIENIPFDDDLPVAELHWIFSDKNGCIVVEPIDGKIQIYDNEVGVLTNNPSFDMQMFNLNNYLSLSSKSPKNTFSPFLNLKVYSRGMGAMGLPGDLSSQSRFVRAAFVKLNSVSGTSEEDSVNQFFHILNSVDNQRGCAVLDNNRYETTIYSACFNTDRGVYYYTTYGNHSITAVDMHAEDLDSALLLRYPFVKGEQITFQNGEK